MVIIPAVVKKKRFRINITWLARCIISKSQVGIWLMTIEEQEHLRSTSWIKPQYIPATDRMGN